jgi:hypothetical protein
VNQRGNTLVGVRVRGVAQKVMANLTPLGGRLERQRLHFLRNTSSNRGASTLSGWIPCEMGCNRRSYLLAASLIGRGTRDIWTTSDLMRRSSPASIKSPVSEHSTLARVSKWIHLTTPI